LVILLRNGESLAGHHPPIVVVVELKPKIMTMTCKNEITKDKNENDIRYEFEIKMFCVLDFDTLSIDSLSPAMHRQMLLDEGKIHFVN
jgi:hypothetical protein